MLCRSWHAYIVAFTQSLQTLLEIILAFRGKSKVISPLEDAVRLDKAHSVCPI